MSFFIGNLKLYQLHFRNPRLTLPKDVAVLTATVDQLVDFSESIHINRMYPVHYAAVQELIVGQGRLV